MAKCIFITGQPGSRKSTLLSLILAEIKGKRIAGIITPEIRKNKKRFGFKIIDIASKEEEIMASTEAKVGPRVSKYRVNVVGIDNIVDKFLKSFKDADLIVLDELAPMELNSTKFKEALEKILKSSKPCLIAVHRRLVKSYEKYGEVFWVRRENFTELKEKIVKELERCENIEKKSQI